MRQLIIANRVISDDSDAYVIAEIGHNHQGSLKTAKLVGPRPLAFPDFVAAASLASYLPARRAASLNPVDALRAE